MNHRDSLQQLVDRLDEDDLRLAQHLLARLAIVNPVHRALALAEIDNEPDDDDRDGGLTAARRDAHEGQLISTAELLRELGLPVMK